MTQRTCSIEGCDKYSQARTWCSAHYRRWSLYGDPLSFAPKPEPESKRCGKCRVELTAANCHRNSKAYDGLQSTCKPCMAAYQREWHQANKARIEPARLAYRDAHRSEMSAYGRAWYAENGARKREMAQAWSREHKVEIAARASAWRAANPLLVLEYAAKRRATLKGAWDEYVDRDLVWERDGGICHLCGELADPNRWDLDHIIPLTPYRGRAPGRHNYENVAVSHPSCNYRKCNRGTSGYAEE